MTSGSAAPLNRRIEFRSLSYRDLLFYSELTAIIAGPDLPDRNITSHDVKPKLDSPHLDPYRPGCPGQRLPPLPIDRSGHLWRSRHLRLVLGIPGWSIRQGPQEGRFDSRGEAAGVARAGFLGGWVGEVGDLDVQCGRWVREYDGKLEG